jgi:hypothetical protein
MKVAVVEQRLTPGVEDSDANLGVETVLAEFEQRGRGGREEQVAQFLLILLNQGFNCGSVKTRWK